MHLIEGETQAWKWVAPEPVETASLEVFKGTSPIAGIPDLERLRDDAAVISISDDRRQLTIEGSLSGAAPGPGFFLSDSDGVFPVTIQAIGDDYVTLADRLPRMPQVLTGTLQWATWSTLFSGADVTASVSDRLIAKVTYDTGETTGVSTSNLFVTKKPFQTGLTTTGLCSDIPEVAEMLPHRENDLQGVIQFAERHVLQDIKHTAKIKGFTLGDFDGTEFYVAHAYRTAQLLFESEASDLAESFGEKYDKALLRALEVIWVDTNENGLKDEDPIRLRGLPTVDATLPEDYFFYTQFSPFNRRW